ncbi:radical SAM protein [Sulfolobus sp. F3]|nr:radical SAM protein [Sulfolobus sp. F3]
MYINYPIPLIGHIAFGIVDRGTNLLQIRPFSNCPMSCIFCSVDAGPNSRYRVTEFIVNSDHLLDWSYYVISKKIHKVNVLIDGVGEPILHPEIHKIIKGLKGNPKVNEVAIETHGLTLNKANINKLVDAGLDRLNVSIDSLDINKAKSLTGHKGYDINKILEVLIYAKLQGIDVLLTPVWLPGINDEDIVEIVKTAKDYNFKIGIQKFIKHKYGRGNDIKEVGWKEFYNYLDDLEKITMVRLKLSPMDFEIFPDIRLGPVFDIGERVIGEVISEGWMRNEMIVKAKNRVITLVDANDLDVGMEVKVRIIRNKDEIYLARLDWQ